MKKEPQIFTRSDDQAVPVSNTVLDMLAQEELSESLVREYIRRTLVEVTTLPRQYFSVIDNAITSSKFWEKPNSHNDIDVYDSPSGAVMATPAAEALSEALHEAMNSVGLDMDVLVRSHDTDNLEEMSLHPDHPAWPNRWLIDASWSVSKQRPGRNTIDIEIMTSEPESRIRASLDTSALVRHIAQTVRHEIVHYLQMKKQAKSKGLDDLGTFSEMLSDPNQIPDSSNPKYWDVYEVTGEIDEAGKEIVRKEGFKDDKYKKDYLSSHIEIDAHAHDGAEELLAVYSEEEIKDILRGKVDLSDRRMPNAITHYYRVLGPSDPATQKFMSKLYTQVQRMKQ